jgi:hypothetical protein
MTKAEIIMNKLAAARIPRVAVQRYISEHNKMQLLNKPMANEQVPLLPSIDTSVYSRVGRP